MLHAICIGLFLPLIGFLILLFSSKSIGRRLAGMIGCSTIFISFLCFVGLLFIYNAYGMNSTSLKLFTWIPVEKINADFTLRLDHLSLVMTLIITGIGFLIHVYSIGYIDDEADYARYFACMNFFVFAMLLLVLAANLVLLFVGWEGVGLASYLLIGFWYQRPSAAAAATKAFVVNRIGDCGFLIGLLLTFYLFGTSDIAEISKLAGEQFSLGAPLLILMTMLLFVGATGKSAQLPLHTWLPDAMEGPTPVSALIHAATMVTAGVYLVVRMHSVYLLAPETLQVIGVVGGVTSLFAAFCAVGQTDLKRVLAYSTVSQLGLMFLACGAGAFYAAMFHLTTHAFVKALLFLSAGNVVHALGTNEMGKMGGLAKTFPKTNGFFLIGVLAMSGIPPMAIFFSKDIILELEYLAGYSTLFYVGVTTSVLTAFYLTRAYCLTFRGKSLVEKKAHEAPSVMILPLSVLAFLAITGGFLGFTSNHTPILESFLNDLGITAAERELSMHLQLNAEALLAISAAFIGVGVSAVLYLFYRDRLGKPLAVLTKAFYINEFYLFAFVRPLKGFSDFIARFLEPHFFDSMLSGTVHTTQGIARGLQKVQSGQIRSYFAWMALGTILLIVYMIR